MVSTLIIWSTCQRFDGENLKAEHVHWTMKSVGSHRSMAKNMFEVQSALNSGSHVLRNVNISLIIVRILFGLTKAKHNSMARLFSNGHSRRHHLSSVFSSLTVWSRHRHLSNTRQSSRDAVERHCDPHGPHVEGCSKPRNGYSYHCSRENDREYSRPEPRWISLRKLDSAKNEISPSSPIPIWYPWWLILFRRE